MFVCFCYEGQCMWTAGCPGVYWERRLCFLILWRRRRRRSTRYCSGWHSDETVNKFLQINSFKYVHVHFRFWLIWWFHDCLLDLVIWWFGDFVIDFRDWLIDGLLCVIEASVDPWLLKPLTTLHVSSFFFFVDGWMVSVHGAERYGTVLVGTVNKFLQLFSFNYFPSTIFLQLFSFNYFHFWWLIDWLIDWLICGVCMYVIASDVGETQSSISEEVPGTVRPPEALWWNWQ